MTGRVVRNVAIISLALLWLVPTYLLIVNAITPMSEYEGSPTLTPKGFALAENIATAWEFSNMSVAFRNSLLYASICSAVAVVVATMAGFAVVALPMRRPAIWFWLIYAGTLLPLQVFVRPLFTVSAETGLYDTRLGLGIVYVAICVPFAFFVVRNYMTTLPGEVTEAARMDGGTWWRIFWNIHVPLSRSAMGAAFIFQFVWVWNELFFGITLTFSPEVRPVIAALAGLQGSYTSVGPPVVLAGALVVSLPTLVLFFMFQRLFVSSLRTNI